MRHFLGSLHQVFLVTRVFIFKEELYINHWYGYGRDLLDSMWHNMPHIWWLYRGNFKWALGNYNSLKAVLHAKEENQVSNCTLQSIWQAHTHTGRLILTLPPVRLSVELGKHKDLEAGTALSSSKRHQKDRRSGFELVLHKSLLCRFTCALSTRLWREIWDNIGCSSRISKHWGGFVGGLLLL